MISCKNKIYTQNFDVNEKGTTCCILSQVRTPNMHGTPVIHQWETPIIHTRADEFSQSTLCEVSKSVLATTVALYLFSLNFQEFRVGSANLGTPVLQNRQFRGMQAQSRVDRL
jgi:hypothetical protein